MYYVVTENSIGNSTKLIGLFSYDMDTILATVNYFQNCLCNN